MYIFFMGVIAFIMFLNLVNSFVVTDKIDSPQEHRQAMLEVDKYRAFMFVADQYMKNDPPAVTSITAVNWDTLKTTPFAAPASRALTMPVNWKIVRRPDDTWVACTDLEERSVTAIGQLLPPPESIDQDSSSMSPVITTSGQAPEYIVMRGDDAPAIDLVNLCKTH